MCSVIQNNSTNDAPENHDFEMIQRKLSREPITTPLRYIVSQSSKPRDLLNILMQEKRNTTYNQYPFYTKILGLQYNTGLEDCNCEIDQICFQELANKYQVNGLSFYLIGHGFIKTDFRHDFSSYDTVTHINFESHFSYITPAFQIISQLKSLKKVAFNLDFHQQPFFFEQLDEDYANLIVPSNPSVCSLTLKVKPIACDMRVIRKILKILIQRAEQCLPNLIFLNLKLPVIDVSKDLLMKIIYNCSMNTVEQLLKFEMTVYPPTISCIYSNFTEKEEVKKPILQGFSGSTMSFPELVIGSSTYVRDRDLHEAVNLVNKVFSTFQALETANLTHRHISNVNPGMMGYLDEEQIQFYNDLQLSLTRRSNLNIRNGNGMAEIDDMINDARRHHQEIERNLEIVRLNRIREDFERYRRHHDNFYNQNEPNPNGLNEDPSLNDLLLFRGPY